MVGNEATWSQQIFGACDLGDSRRTRRLVDVGERLARQVGASMAQCCEGETAALLGSYRLIRNEWRVAGSDSGRRLGVERQPFQSATNLERMLVITAFLAARLLQLREHLHPTEDKDSNATCDTVLTSEEWHVL